MIVSCCSHFNPVNFSKTSQCTITAVQMEYFYKPNHLVQLYNLKNRPSWNGRLAKIAEDGYNVSQKRYAVELLFIKPTQTVLITPDNLKISQRL